MDIVYTFAITHTDQLRSVGPGNETIILIFMSGVSLENLDILQLHLQVIKAIDTSCISCLSFIRHHVIVDQNS